MIMAIRGRRWFITSIVTLVLVIGSVIYGTTRKPHISIPTFGDVRSIQVIFNSTIPNPKPILSSSPQGQADIAQLLGWIESAKSMGYEQSSPFVMSMGPTEVVLKLDNHKEIDILEAWLPATTTQPDGRVLQVLKRSNEYVDVQSSDNNKLIRYYSPQLADWLNNGWQKDWKQ